LFYEIYLVKINSIYLSMKVDFVGRSWFTSM